MRNFLKEKLAKGRTVIGTWSVIPSAAVADVIAASGLDFLIVDAEHGPANFETAMTMAMACQSREVSPLMRVGGVVESDILRALDIGMHGVHVPNISTAAELSRAVSFCLYPPQGKRGFSVFTRAAGYAASSSPRTVPLVVAHVEKYSMLDQLDSILEVPGVDVLFIGRFDLAMSLGLGRKVDHPKMTRLVERLARRIRKAKKIPGTIVTQPKGLKQMISCGVGYITYSADCDLLLDAYRRVRENL